jgi:hypothetical protein
MEGVGGSSCSLLSGDVAVFCCCTGALRVSFVGAARCAVPTDRPSVFQAGHIPGWRGSWERYALSPVAAVSQWHTRIERDPQHVAELLASSLPNSNRIPELLSWL